LTKSGVGPGFGRVQLTRHALTGARQGPDKRTEDDVNRTGTTTFGIATTEEADRGRATVVNLVAQALREDMVSLAEVQLMNEDELLLLLAARRGALAS